MTEDLKRSRVRLDSDSKKLDNWIDYHREQIFNLHKLLKKSVSMPDEKEDNFSVSSPHTPKRKPLI